MKNHWQSSEKPLYVRLVWRKNSRHVVLFREGAKNPKPKIKSQLRSSLQSNTPSTNISEPELHTYLTSCHLENHRIINEKIPAGNRELPQHINTAVNKYCTIKSAPKSHCNTYKTKLAEEVTIPKTEICSSSHQEETTLFTDRIIDWLTTNPKNFYFIDPKVDDKDANILNLAEKNRRPRTSWTLVSKYERNSRSYNFKSASVEEEWIINKNLSNLSRVRPQLHVFVPIRSVRNSTKLTVNK